MEAGNATNADSYESFCFHTNKGGVGKTTLCFHSVVTYAQANPDCLVVAVDCDSQANLSATMLTQLGSRSSKRKREAKEYIAGADVVEMMEKSENGGIGPERHWSKTIGGLLHAEAENNLGTALKIAPDFLIDVHEHNDNMPCNIRLLCGDTRCDVLAPGLQTKADGKFTPFVDPYKYILTILKVFCENLNKIGPTSRFQSMTVFFDTNPALNLLTQMALCASHKLIIPLNADDYSKQGVAKMFHSLYGMHPIEGPLEAYESDMFHAKVEYHKIPIAKIHAFINNKSVMNKDSSASTFAALQGQISNMIHQEYLEAKNSGRVEKVFNAPEDPDDLDRPEKFQRHFTGTMRDMMSCGAASIHSGLPLWLLKRNKANIRYELNSVIGSAKSSFEDIVGSVRGASADTCLMALLLRHNQISHRDLLTTNSGLTQSQRTMLWEEFDVGASANT